MPEWIGWTCYLVGCFWAGAAFAAGMGAMLGFGSGWWYSGFLGRRDGQRVVAQMIQTETARVAEQARREDVVAAVQFVNQVGEMANMVLTAMEKTDAG